MFEYMVPWWKMMVVCITIGIFGGMITCIREKRAYINGFNDGVEIGLHMNDETEGEDDT